METTSDPGWSILGGMVEMKSWLERVKERMRDWKVKIVEIGDSVEELLLGDWKNRAVTGCDIYGRTV